MEQALIFELIAVRKLFLFFLFMAGFELVYDHWISSQAVLNLLNLRVPIQDEERKLNEIFIFTLLCGTSEGFMKAFKSKLT